MNSALLQRAAAALDVAAANAASVDRDNRFPAETIAALREARLLGVMVPAGFGGEDASLAEVAELCSRLGQRCASSAMIFAMHQIKLSSLVAHGAASEWHRGFLRRVASQQLLLASATTEGGGIGGNMRTSNCAVETDGDVFVLKKDAAVISYGDYADAILITARRAPDAPMSDQVMAVLTRDQYRLTHTSRWDTIGMRGTCSNGFSFEGRAPVQQIFPVGFGEIVAHSMLAHAHIFWGSLWYGIAADAVARAQAFLRAESRKKPGETPPGSSRVIEALAMLGMMRATIHGAIARFEASRESNDALDSMSFGIDMNSLKLNTSRLVNDIVRECLMVCGIEGYRTESRFSLSRHVRDAMSAPLMINNDRIVANNATLAAGHRSNQLMAG